MQTVNTAAAERLLTSKCYQGVDNNAQPKTLYLGKIALLNEDELAEECERKIWLSAFTNNNPRSDYHWQVDACWDECSRRGQESIYEAAFERAKARA